MKKTLALFLALTAGCAELGPSSQVKESKAGRFELSAPDARVLAEIAPELGGRVVTYSLGGENILLPEKGCQIDIGPEPRKIPAHPAIWSGRYEHTHLRTAPGVRLRSAPEPNLGLRVVKEFGIDARTGALELVAKMLNVSERETSYCFWDRTLVEGGGWCLLPVNPKSKFPAKWVLGKRTPTVPWEYDGKTPSHPDMRLMNDVLVVKTGGPEQKVGTDTADGWIAYARGRVLYVKYFPVFPAGRYTDNGMTLAHYYREAFSELEPLSPEVTLKPGQEFVFPQAWALIPLEREVTSFEEARALVERLPRSPFK